jgi:hypothetical protein
VICSSEERKFYAPFARLSIIDQYATVKETNLINYIKADVRVGGIGGVVCFGGRGLVYEAGEGGRYEECC